MEWVLENDMLILAFVTTYARLIDGGIGVGRTDLISEEYHARELEIDNKYRALPGETKRRRKLRRPPTAQT